MKSLVTLILGLKDKQEKKEMAIIVLAHKKDNRNE